MKIKITAILEKIVLLSVSLVIAELILRGLGLPARINTQAPQHATQALLDTEVGWKNRPGSYFVINPAEPQLRKIVTINQDGARNSGAEQNCKATKRKIVLLGDSFPFGMGLDDRETVAWQLAQKISGACIENHAVPGYGTYQSLLRMRQIVRENPDYEYLFIYGFNTFHELRNVGDPLWQRLVRWGQGEVSANLPFCGLDATGKLEENSQRKLLPQVPFRNYLSLSVLIEELIAHAMSRYQHIDKYAVTSQLLLKMQQLASESGAKLIIAFLSSESEKYQHYVEFIASHSLNSIDCRHPHGDLTEYQIPGDSHPNAPVHAYWSECFAHKIDFFAGN